MKYAVVCREASFSGVLMDGERRKFTTLAEVQAYVKARWQGPDYIDGPDVFHSDYCQYQLVSCTLSDLGTRGAPGTDEFWDWRWKDLEQLDPSGRSSHSSLGAASESGRGAARPRTHNRFERGSGCYTCQNCKRKTRSTGRGDNENVGLCEECYEMAGIDNAFADGQGTPEMRAEWHRLKAACIAKGGTL